MPANGASELFAQLQMLQEELRELRGKLEEQANQLAQLEQQQKDNYLDLDGRLSALMAGGMAGAGVPTPAAAPGAAPTPGAPPQVPAAPGAAGPVPPQPAPTVAPPTPGVTTPPPAVGAADKGAYDVAYELLKQGRMDEALSGFESFVGAYPTAAWCPMRCTGWAKSIWSRTTRTRP